jgi:hypothetical protein
MSHIHSRGGRFVVVMSRTLTEDGTFRKLLQTDPPVWPEAAIEALDTKLAGPRSRFKIWVAVEQAATETLAGSGGWVSFTMTETMSTS